MDNAYPTMEASFKSVCDSVSWKADRKLAYGLVKNKKPFFTGPTGSATKLFKLFKNAVYKLIRIDPSFYLCAMSLSSAFANLNFSFCPNPLGPPVSTPLPLNSSMKLRILNI